MTRFYGKILSRSGAMKNLWSWVTGRERSSNVYLKSNETSRCFWEKLWETLLLLKTKCGWVGLLDLRLKIFLSWAYLLGSGLKLIFYWKANSLTFFKSSFNSFEEVFTLWTTENNDVSAKSLPLEVKLSDKSFI